MDGATLRQFERPSATRAAWQIANSLVPYLATLAAMWWTMRRGLPWWTTLALAFPAAGFMVRLFIFMHDCTHASFLSSRRAERVLGRVLGVIVFTPFDEWGHEHLAHHATSGDLSRRGAGDVWTMTVDEYLAAPPARRLQYRLARNPFLMLLFGPLGVFLFRNRFPTRGASRARVRSVLYTDAALGTIAAVAAATIGLRAYLLVQIPVLFLAGAWAARTTGSRRCCSGSRGTSASITCTTCGRASPTTTCSAVSTRRPSSAPAARSRSSAASTARGSRCGTRARRSS
jgi:omega-6 fatty acid desaturase (delta-12 desaturase)